MKKAGILTYYNVHNHGSSLQSYASKKVLESFGYNVEFLRFDRNYDFISEIESKKYRISFRSIPFYIGYTVKKGLTNIIFNFSKHKILKKFTKKYLIEGVRYSDFKGDVILIGSDEVFSMKIGVNPFFYGIGLNAKRIIGYAASFGPTTIEFIKEHRLQGLISGGLQNIDGIGVRDKNSQKIIEAYANLTPEIVCDPVILYGYKEEQTLFKPKKSGEYILIYSYDKNLNSSSDIEKIIKFARQNKKKIYSVGYHHKWCDKNICPSPFELLGYFKNAFCVITNTFHGAVISLITNAQFVVQLAGNKNKLKYLLDEYLLDDRIVTDFSNLNDIYESKIDYNSVNDLLENNREKSLQFLSKKIRGIDD